MVNNAKNVKKENSYVIIRNLMIVSYLVLMATILKVNKLANNVREQMLMTSIRIVFIALKTVV